MRTCSRSKKQRAARKFGFKSRSTRLRYGRARGSRLLLGGRSLGRVRPEAVGRVVEHVEHVAAPHVHDVVEGGAATRSRCFYTPCAKKNPSKARCWHQACRTALKRYPAAVFLSCSEAKRLAIYFGRTTMLLPVVIVLVGLLPL